MILSESGRIQKAIETLDKAFQYDLINARTVVCLYQSHIRNNDAGAARQTLKRYQNGLRMADFDQEEIDMVVMDIINDA